MLAVIVAVMEVRVMGMAMHHPAMRMRVCMRLVLRPGETVAVLMMLIVHVGMRMLHRLVQVLMLVALRQVQPHAERHERGRDPEGG